MGRPILNRVGEVHVSNKGEKIEVIECLYNRYLTILFEDGTVVTGVQYGDLKRGTVKNYNKPSFLGVGFVGYGIYCTLKHKDAYKRWGDIIRRCYKGGENNPTYDDCTVHESWHNFQNFAEWYYANVKEGWQLDKDILIPGNKIYGLDTCCFVPPEINYLFRRHVKCKTVQDVIEATEKYKHLLSDEVYVAIIRYK